MALTYSQHMEIERRYERIRNRNARIINERRQEVYEKISELKDINQQLSDCHSQLFQCYLNQTPTAIVDKEIAKLAEQKQKLIDSNFPKGYLEPIYECDTCKDKGYINNTPCNCFKKFAVELLYAQSNSRNINPEHTFENFDFELYSNTEESVSGTGITVRENAKLLVNHCKRSIFNIHKEPFNLFLYGDVGVGKTYTMDCIFNELVKSLHSTVYLTAPEFFDDVAKQTYGTEKWDKHNSEYDPLLECDLLIIDDLGTEVINSFSQSKFFHYVNTRLLSNKSTVISSNLSLPELRDSYSERIHSRITGEFECFTLYGEDLRNK